MSEKKKSEIARSLYSVHAAGLFRSGFQPGICQTCLFKSGYDLFSKFMGATTFS